MLTITTNWEDLAKRKMQQVGVMMLISMERIERIVLEVNLRVMGKEENYSPKINVGQTKAVGNISINVLSTVRIVL